MIRRRDTGLVGESRNESGQAQHHADGPTKLFGHLAAEVVELPVHSIGERVEFEIHVPDLLRELD